MSKYRALPALAAVAALAATAAPASAAPATVTVANDSFSPKNVSINAGEAVTWDVQQGGHNIDVWDGPETWKSTSGKDAKGTQVTHVFNAAGTYQYVCDYHSGMRGTVTVASAAPSGGGSGSGSGTGTGTGTGSGSGTGTGSGSGTSSGTGSTSGSTTGTAPANGTSPTGAAGPAGATGSAAVDAAAPTLSASVPRHGVLRVRTNKAGKLVVRARNLRTRKLSKRAFAVKAGTSTVSLRSWLQGRFRVSAVLVDAAGNQSKAIHKTLVVRR